MKTTLIKTIVLLAVIAFVFSKQKNSGKEVDIFLNNIEALASGEYTNMDCWGTGSVDCPINNSKASYIYWSR